MPRGAGGEVLMNPATAIVGIVLIAIVLVAIKSMIKDKKNGKSLQCGGDCSKCKGHCG